MSGKSVSDSRDSQKWIEGALQNANASREVIGFFIDNSNLFIEGRKFYAIHLKLLVPQDPHFRVHIGPICVALLKGRHNNVGRLYGSEPPALDTVWEQIRKCNIEVSTYLRTAKDKEKEVDNAITADITEHVIRMTAAGKTGTIILLAGGRDYCPVVKKALSYEWKVEIAAFSNSISSEFTKLSKEKDTLLSISSLDDMMKDNPKLYFVNRKFERSSQNGRGMRKMKPSRTMAIKFKENFDIVRDRKKFTDLADKITVILKIPCYYKPERNGNLLFILSATNARQDAAKCQEKDKMRNELEKSGIPADQIRNFLKIHFGNTDEQPSNIVDFGDRWKRHSGILIKTCEEFFGTVSFCKTYVDYVNSTPNSERTPVENKFEALGEMVDDQDASEDDDDDFCESDDEDGKEEQSNAEMAGAATENLEGFQEVDRQRRKKKIATFSARCKYSFNCNKGSNCGYTHTDDERKFFKSNGGQGARGYKSKPCHYHFKQYQRGSCKKGRTGKEPLCPYYHSIAEARCYECQKYGGEVGHPITKCPKKSSDVDN